MILSEDSDLLQLIDPHTSVYQPIKDREVTLETFEQQVGITPERFLLRKAIAGDGAEAPGMAGVGQKTAQQIACQAPQTKRAFVRWCAQHANKRIQTVSQHLATIERNLALVDIAQEEFTPDELAQIKTQAWDTPRQPYDEQATLRLLLALEFQQILDGYDWWSVPFRRLV